MTAALEAEEHGAVFGIGQITRSFLLEGKMLQDSYDAVTKDEAVSAANKRWRAILDKRTQKWSKGQAYVRLWKKGVRPTYLKSLSESAQKAVNPPKPKPQEPQQPVQEQGPMKQGPMKQGPMKQEVDHFHIGAA
jgi:hypothetical protein